MALDTSRVPLARAVHAGGLDLIKPNDDELAELVGHEIGTVGEAVDAAREAIAAGTRAVLLTLGAHGALLVSAERSWWAGGAPLQPASTVGAGDTTLAGYLATAGAPGERLRAAVAWGRAAVLLPGTQVPAPSQIDLAAVRLVPDPERDTLLKELCG